MAALFIIAIISVSGATILLRTVESREAIEAANIRVRAVQQVHAMLRDDLAQWVPRDFHPRELIDPASRFSGGDAREIGHLMSFVRDGWTNPRLTEKRSGLIVVRYLMRNGQLVRQVRLTPNSVTGSEEIEQIMMEGIEDAEILFRQNDIWVPQWEAKAQTQSGPPPAVSLRITMRDGRSYDWLFLTPAEVGLT